MSGYFENNFNLNEMFYYSTGNKDYYIVDLISRLFCLNFTRQKSVFRHAKNIIKIVLRIWRNNVINFFINIVHKMYK